MLAHAHNGAYCRIEKNAPCKLAKMSQGSSMKQRRWHALLKAGSDELKGDFIVFYSVTSIQTNQRPRFPLFMKGGAG